MSKAWYLAGPMSYMPQMNFPMFDRVAEALRKQKYVVRSPAEMDDPEIREAALASKDGVPMGIGGTWGDFLARDVKLIADEVNGIVFLPGWERSRGARLEAFVGLLQGPAFRFERWDDNGNYAVPVSRRTVLDEIYVAMLQQEQNRV